SDARTAIHISHRLGALMVVAVLLMLSWKLHRTGLSGLARLVLAALALQVGLGISNVLLHLPLGVAVAHNAGGALLLLAMVLVNYRIRVVDKVRVGLGWRLRPITSGGVSHHLRNDTWRQF
ncbi:COX15/CtaA family protein, partial [Pseudomonas sp. MH2]